MRILFFVTLVALAVEAGKVTPPKKSQSKAVVAAKTSAKVPPVKSASRAASLPAKSASSVARSSSKVVSVTLSSSKSEVTKSSSRGSSTSGRSSILSLSKLSSASLVSSSVTSSGSSASLTSSASSLSAVTRSTSTPSSTSSSTSSSPSSSAAGLVHIVWPKNYKNKKQAADISKALSLIVKDPKQIYASPDGKSFGPSFWRLRLSPQDVTALSKNPFIAAVVEAGCNKECYDPTSALGIQKQTIVEPEMTLLSQRPGTELADYSSTYFYKRSAAINDVTVYLIDTGARLEHVEFTQGENVASRARWIFEGELPDSGQFEETDQAPTYHRTCMLSRITGRVFGTSKRVNPVIVKVGRQSSLEGWVDAVALVRRDVERKGIKKGVVSMSWGLPQRFLGGAGGAAYIDALYGNLLELDRLGITLVAAAGNDDSSSITEYPAKFGGLRSPYPPIPGLIVVGAIKPTTFQRWSEPARGKGSDYDTAAGLPHVYAPGADGDTTTCAEGNPNVPGSQYMAVKGTSPATATIAGLAAYMIAENKVGSEPVKIKKRIVDLAWVRPTPDKTILPEGLKTAYNGITEFDIKFKCFFNKRGEEACVMPGANQTEEEGSQGSVRRHARAWSVPVDA